MDNPELYAVSSNLQQELVDDVLSELWPLLDWRPERRRGAVLDVGCGAGDVTAQVLLPRLPPEVSVVAVDVSPAMLAKAARFSGPRLCFNQLDIISPRIEDTTVWSLAPFSKVFSFFCLHWVQDQRLAIQNISKLLCPEGEAVLLIVTDSPNYVAFERLATTSQWGAYMEDYRQFEPPYRHREDPERDLRKYLHEAGFCVRTWRNQRNYYYYSEDEQKVLNTLIAINPFVGRVPEALREEFLQDYTAAAYGSGTIFASSSGHYCFPYKAIVAHAVKT